MGKELLIFDVNETLLDLTPLKEAINKALHNEQAASLWFSTLLHYSLVETVCNRYQNFSEIGVAAFKLIQNNFDKSYSETEIQAILSSIDKLQAYPEVPDVLKNLSKDYTLMAFSNGKPEVLNNQLEYAGIIQFFDHVLSVEGCRKYKPHHEAYEFALKKSSANAREAFMIAAHGWDVAGAAYAGMKTAFVERGKNIYSLAPKPSYLIKDLSELEKMLNSE